jgi:hypothetical protein
MENILLAVVIGFAVWLFMRRTRMMRANKQRMAQPAPDAGAGAAPQPKSMPRFGIAGSITRQQITLLKQNDFEPHRQWSKEEAQLVIDSVTYLRAAIRVVTGEAGAPIEIQNNVLGFILGDDALRDSVLDWGLNRTHEEEDAGEDVELPDDETFERIAEYIRQLWDDA